jgi:hypothetical protein
MNTSIFRFKLTENDHRYLGCGAHVLIRYIKTLNINRFEKKIIWPKLCRVQNALRFEDGNQSAMGGAIRQYVGSHTSKQSGAYLYTAKLGTRLNLSKDFVNRVKRR